jgi:hypothetical protein
VSAPVSSHEKSSATAVVVAWVLAALGILVVLVAGPLLMMGESGRARLACGAFLLSGPQALVPSALLMTIRPAWAVIASGLFGVIVTGASVAWYLATVERAGPQANTLDGVAAMIACAMLPGAIPHLVNLMLGIRVLRERSRSPLL